MLFREIVRSLFRHARTPDVPAVQSSVHLAQRPSAEAVFSPNYPKSHLDPSVVSAIIDTVRPLTMVHETGVEFVIHETVRLIESDIPGLFVECGVWRGGCFLAALLAQPAAFGEGSRPTYILDSFEGLPLVTEKDGPLAAAWQKGEVAETFLENCRAA